jgi:hypothetical protein
MGAILATRDVAAERCRAAGFDGRHDAQLAEAQMAGLTGAIGWPVAAEDIRNLQGETGQEPRRSGRWGCRRARCRSRSLLGDRFEGEFVQRPFDAPDQL